MNLGRGRVSKLTPENKAIVVKILIESNERFEKKKAKQKANEQQVNPRE